MAVATPNHIPTFIVASTPKRLRRLMLQTNAKLGATVQYFDIQYANGKWYAWYYEPITSEIVNDLAES